MPEPPEPTMLMPPAPPEPELPFIPLPPLPLPPLPLPPLPVSIGQMSVPPDVFPPQLRAFDGREQAGAANNATAIHSEGSRYFFFSMRSPDTDFSRGAPAGGAVIEADMPGTR